MRPLAVGSPSEAPNLGGSFKDFHIASEGKSFGAGPS